MNNNQIQIRVSVSSQLGDLLKSKANRLGLPITQLVKHLIIKDVESEEYPTYEASNSTVNAVEKAMKEYKNGKAIKVDNIDEYFKSL